MFMHTSLSINIPPACSRNPHLDEGFSAPLEARTHRDAYFS